MTSYLFGKLLRCVQNSLKALYSGWKVDISQIKMYRLHQLRFYIFNYNYCGWKQGEIPKWSNDSNKSASITSWTKRGPNSPIVIILCSRPCKTPKRHGNEYLNMNFGFCGTSHDKWKAVSELCNSFSSRNMGMESHSTFIRHN